MKLKFAISLGLILGLVGTLLAPQAFAQSDMIYAPTLQEDQEEGKIGGEGGVVRKKTVLEEGAEIYRRTYETELEYVVEDPLYPFKLVLGTFIPCTVAPIFSGGVVGMAGGPLGACVLAGVGFLLSLLTLPTITIMAIVGSMVSAWGCLTPATSVGMSLCTTFLSCATFPVALLLSLCFPFGPCLAPLNFILGCAGQLSGTSMCAFMGFILGVLFSSCMTMPCGGFGCLISPLFSLPATLLQTVVLGLVGALSGMLLGTMGGGGIGTIIGPIVCMPMIVASAILWTFRPHALDEFLDLPDWLEDVWDVLPDLLGRIGGLFPKILPSGEEAMGITLGGVKLGDILGALRALMEPEWPEVGRKPLSPQPGLFDRWYSPE